MRNPTKSGKSSNSCSYRSISPPVRETWGRSGFEICPGFRHCLLLLLLLALGACAWQRPAIPSGAPGEGALTGAQWLQKLRERAEHWNSYQAILRIRVESPKGKNSFRAVVSARPPGLFRLEATSLFGQTVGVFVLNAKGASLWAPSERTLFTAAKARDLTGYFLGASIQPELFEYGVVACIPPSQLDGDFKMSREAAGWVGTSRDARRGLTTAWRFVGEPPALKEMVVTGGLEEYAIRYDPPVAMENPEKLPERITFRAADWRMEVALSQATISGELDDALFEAPVSPESKVVSLDGVK